MVAATVATAQVDPARALFTNVHVFGGVNEARIGNANVLVEGNLIKKVSAREIAFGTDLLFDPSAAAKQGTMLAESKRWFTPYEALRMATSTNPALLAVSGSRSPYQDGALGGVKEGAYADLILVEGNSLEILDLVADPDENFVLIMKDGKIYKNAL